jgi:hypothetical protein
MNNIRYDIFSGRLEGIGSTGACVEFTEWHDKNGIDFMFYSDGDIREISLSKDEAHSICLAISSMGYVDLDAVKIETTELVTNSENRREKLKKLREKQAEPSVFTGMGNLTVLSEDDPE